MSDTCRINITVANRDVDEAKFLLHGADETIAAESKTELVLYECHPMEIIQLQEAGLTFVGHHESGANYDATTFACKDEQMVSCKMGWSAPFLCPVDKQGIIDPQALSDIQEHIRLSQEITEGFAQDLEESSGPRP